MKRDIYQQLTDWKTSSRRKPLILQGARQVGKTYVLKKFAENEYEKYVYVNFDEDKNLHSLFTESLDPSQIIKKLEIYFSIEINPESTFIFFDEIQECSEALNSLKYFCEKANQYHIAAAGSLLGILLSNTKGFPVGKVNFLHLYPLSFSEFLTAIHETSLRKYLDDFTSIQPISELFHQKLLNYFLTYLYVGGMPEAVREYVATKNLAEVRVIHKEIIKAYEFDFSKHAPENMLMKLNQIWQSIPAQLAKENKKFQYTQISKNARAREYIESIQWLKDAGIILLSHNISKPALPLSSYTDNDIFKVYLLDVGLLGAMNNVPAKLLLEEYHLLTEYKGSLVENYVSQTLIPLFEGQLHYWQSPGKAEIDFIIPIDNHAIPLEVKSGTSGHMKSLRVYQEKYQPDFVVRTSPLNLKKDGNFINIPLYFLTNFLKHPWEI